MAMPSRVKIGDKFGRLTVIGFCGVQMVSGKHNRVWKCKCECGNIVDVIGSKLSGGQKRSCGCLMIEHLKESPKTHGKSHSKEFNAWQRMKQRCYTKGCDSYKFYGARGIKVCDRWLHSFENFLADMGEAPKGYSIDRIDPDGDYCPENCRWASIREQQNNKRNTFFITFNGITKPLSYWSETLGIKPNTIHARIRYLHWSIEKALTKQPKQQRGRC